MIQSTHQLEVEWHIWCSQHIRWKWNDRYDRVNISDGSGMTYDTVNISDGRVDCIISVIPLPYDVLTIVYVIPLPSDMLTVLYLSLNFYLICWLYHIWHSTWKWNDRYGTLNISDGSGMTDMIHSTYQMEVE
jgi:hypothetical protein